MRKSKQILMTLIITLALVALACLSGRGRVKEATITVLAARNDIAAGQQLAADDLMQIEIPASLKTASYLTEYAEAIGLWNDARLQAGELISLSRLTKDPEGLKYPNPGHGRRLLTLELEPASANGYWLSAGNRVDIYLIPRNSENGMDIQVLESIRIMTVIGDGHDSSAMSPMTSTKETLICLDLSNDQARLLASTMGICDIRLAVINEPVTMLSDPAA